MIKFRCVSCEQKIGVPDDKAGRRCKCPKCGEVNDIPVSQSLAADRITSSGDHRKSTGSTAASGEPIQPAAAAEMPGAPAATPRPVVHDRNDTDSNEESDVYGLETAPRPLPAPAAAAPGAEPEGAPAEPEISTTFIRPEPGAPRDEQEPEDGDEFGLLGLPFVRYGVLGVLLATTLLAAMFGNVVTLAFCGLLTLAVVNGYWLGASKITSVIGGLLVAALLGVPAGRALENVIGGAIGLTGLTGRLVSIAIFSIFVIVAVSFVLHYLIRKWIAKRPRLASYDRPLGAAMGLVEGALLSVVLIWAVLSMEPMAASGVEASRARPDAPPNPVAEGVVNAAGSIRESVVGRAADTVNPLRDLRLFTVFQKVLVVMNDPFAREVFLTRPVIADIEQRPVVQQAMDAMAEDEQLNAILERGDGITAGDLKTILDSETVLRIFDETTIIEELKPLVGEIEEAVEFAYARLEEMRASGELREN